MANDLAFEIRRKRDRYNDGQHYGHNLRRNDYQVLKIRREGCPHRRRIVDHSLHESVRRARCASGVNCKAVARLTMLSTS